MTCVVVEVGGGFWGSRRSRPTTSLFLLTCKRSRGRRPGLLRREEWRSPRLWSNPRGPRWWICSGAETAHTCCRCSLNCTCRPQTQRTHARQYDTSVVRVYEEVHGLRYASGRLREWGRKRPSSYRAQRGKGISGWGKFQSNIRYHLRTGECIHERYLVACSTIHAVCGLQRTAGFSMICNIIEMCNVCYNCFSK